MGQTAVSPAGPTGGRTCHHARSAAVGRTGFLRAAGARASAPRWVAVGWMPPSVPCHGHLHRAASTVALRQASEGTSPRTEATTFYDLELEVTPCYRCHVPLVRSEKYSHPRLPGKGLHAGMSPRRQESEATLEATHHTRDRGRTVRS